MIKHIKSIKKEGILKHMRVGRTKAKDLIVNVIGKFAKKRLEDLLKNNTFSIGVDESTDR